MLLKSLKLENIRSYVRETVNFPDGAVLLSGDIGSGKSTILLAIEFALFGTRRDGLSGQALLRQGEKTGSVEMNFSIDGREITVKRVLKRGPTSVAQDAGWMVVDGVKSDLTTQEIKSKILEILGYPPELLTKSKSMIYRYTVYTPQEHIKEIIMTDTESRINILRKVFGIDKYKKISENASIYLKSIKDEKKFLQLQIADIPFKEAAVREKQMQRSDILSQVEEITPKLSGMKELLDEQKKKLEEEEIRISRLGDLRKKVEIQDAKLKHIVDTRKKNADEIASMTSIATALQEKEENIEIDEEKLSIVEELERQVTEKEELLMKSEQMKASLKEKAGFMEKRLNELKYERDIKKSKTELIDQKKDLIEELRENVKGKDDIQEKIDVIDATHNEIGKKVQELIINRNNSEILKSKINSLDNCPTCKQDVSDSHKKNICTEEEKKLQSYEEKLSKYNEEREKLDLDIKALNISMEELMEHEKKIESLKIEMVSLEQVKDELTNLEMQYEQMTEEKLKVVADLDNLNNMDNKEMREGLHELKLKIKESMELKLKAREKEHLRQQVAEKERLVIRLQQQQEQLKKEVILINQEKSTLYEQITSMQNVELDFQIKKQAYEETLQKERELAIKEGELKKSLEGVDSLLAVMEADLNERMDSKRKLDKLTHNQEWIEDFFLNLTGTMEKHIMQTIYHEFNSHFTDWFDLLVEDDNLHIRLDDKFTPVVTQNGYEIEVQHLSGGEKTAIALSYRLALNKVINDVVADIKTKDIIILDEPTDGFSTEQLDKLKDVIEELNIAQVLLVSHESKIESMVDHVLRIHKNEHVSRLIS